MKAWTIAIAATATIVAATDSQYDYPACAVSQKDDKAPKYFCCTVAGENRVYKQYHRPTGEGITKYYEEGWNKPRQINWVPADMELSMYKPDSPEFVYGDKTKMCKLIEVVTKGTDGKDMVVTTQQCTFAPASGDKRFIQNTSIVEPGFDDASIFMYSKPVARNSNATFPEGAKCFSIQEYVVNGRFDEVAATGKDGKCSGGFFGGKYRYNTFREPQIVFVYVVYAICFGLLLLWALVRTLIGSSAKAQAESDDLKAVEEGTKKLLDARGGPQTPSTTLELRKSEARLRHSVEDIVQTGFSDSVLGKVIFGYFILATIALNALLIVLILDNTGFYKNKNYDALFNPFEVIIKVWIGLWAITSVWLGCVVVYKEKMFNFFRTPAPLSTCQRVRMFKPEQSEVLLADRSGISQFVQRIETILTSTLFPSAQEGVEETVPVQTASDGSRFIEFQHLRYSFDPVENKFVPGTIVLPSTYDRILAEGTGLSDAEHQRRLDLVGRNAIEVEMPSIARSIVDEVFVFFYVYQLMCYYVWYFTDYKWVAALNTVVIFFAALINITTKRGHFASIVKMTHYQTDVEVLRDGVWKTIGSADLAPGDLVRVAENWEMPCDMAIVKGSTVCDESMLTGESMPVQKFPIPEDSRAAYEPEASGKKYTLFAGTKTLASGRNEEILAVVQSTGAHTSRGQLVQAILFPAPLRFKYDEHLKAVVGFLFCFGFVAAYLAMKFLIANAGLSNTLFGFVYGMFMFSAVLNPLLPVVITIGQVNAAKRLKEKAIYCLNPARITLAGKVRVFCFDKTGTITKQGLDYRGCVPVSNAAFEAEVNDSTAENLNKLFQYALASCHAVGSLNGTLVGNEVEVKMFSSTKWSLVEEEGKMPVVQAPVGNDSLVVVKRFEFDHHRMSMSVVMKNEATGKVYVFCKGSYEKMQAVSTPSTVPADYKTVAENLAKDGCYVLGMSYKEVADMSEEAMHAFLADRDAVEEGLSLLGLIMFRNELKDDSRDAILKLKAGDVRPVMITGDNAMTGCYIARASGMVNEDARVVLGDVVNGELSWSDVDSKETFTTEQVRGFASSVELAVTGKAFDNLVQNELINELLFNIRIFSRMTPNGKVQCVKLHMAAGAVSGMCGDGGNDCGALRIAHVGIALSEAEASVVSPFTSKTKSLESVVDVVIEGRGALATSFASVKYLILYGLIGIGIRFVMYKNSVFISQFGFMFLDGAISTGLAYSITRSRPLKKLGTQRPTSSLVGTTTLVSMLGQTLIHVVFLYFGIQYVMTRSWYCPFDPTGVNLVQWWHLQDSNLGTSLFVLGSFQQMVGGITCSLGSRFRRSVWRNSFLVAYYLVLLGFLALIFLAPPSRLSDQFRISSSTNVVTLPDIPLPSTFRWELFLIGVANTLVVIGFEWFVVLGPVRDFVRAKYHKDALKLKM